MMKLFAVCIAFAALAFGQNAKPTSQPTPVAAFTPIPITAASERLTVLDLYAQFAGLQEKEKDVSDSLLGTELGKKRANLMKQIEEVQANINRLNAQISETPLGKELGEINRQEQNFGKKFNEAVAPLMKAHNCPNGQITPSLELKNCDKPAQ